MPSVEVTSYTLQTGLLGRLGDEQLVLLRHARRGDQDERIEATATVTFSDRFGPDGFGVMGATDRLQVFLPSAQYPVWVDLLRHEDPVFLHWSSEGDGHIDPEAVVHLSTGPELTGEGPVDLTP